jgi:hypothetical protein
MVPITARAAAAERVQGAAKKYGAAGNEFRVATAKKPWPRESAE